MEGTTNVYAAGDVAALEGPDWRAKQGHTAEVMARNAAFNIVASEAGRPERKGYQAHLGYTAIGVVQLILGILTCGIVSGIWGFVEGILILTGSINCDAQGRPLTE